MMGDKQEESIQPHVKRNGWLKNNNPPGDFNKAPRCGAKTRKSTPCQAPAMANGRCRLHGGLSTGAPLKNQNAFKHGMHTREEIEKKKFLRQFLKDCNNTLDELVQT